MISLPNLLKFHSKKYSKVENYNFNQYMENVKFIRVDSDVASALKGEQVASENVDLEALFKEASANEQLKVKFETLKSSKIPAMLTHSEEARRLEEMMRMYSGNIPSEIPGSEETLVINCTCPLIGKLESLLASDRTKALRVASYVYKLAVLSQRKLSADEMSRFLEESFSLLEEI